MSHEARIRSLGIDVPAAPAPAGAYAPAVRCGEWLYVSGQLPSAGGELRYRGKVGRDVTPDEAYQAARLCALNVLAAARGALGTLDRVRQVARVTVFVNSAPGFTAQPQVANGASDLLAAAFGEAGRHARAAVGCSELPLDAAVEVDAILQVEP